MKIGRHQPLANKTGYRTKRTSLVITCFLLSLCFYVRLPQWFFLLLLLLLLLCLKTESESIHIATNFYNRT